MYITWISGVRYGTEKKKEERGKSRYFCGFLAFGIMKENIRWIRQENIYCA